MGSAVGSRHWHLPAASMQQAKSHLQNCCEVSSHLENFPTVPNADQAASQTFAREDCFCACSGPLTYNHAGCTIPSSQSPVLRGTRCMALLDVSRAAPPTPHTTHHMWEAAEGQPLHSGQMQTTPALWPSAGPSVLPPALLQPQTSPLLQSLRDTTSQEGSVAKLRAVCFLSILSEGWPKSLVSSHFRASGWLQRQSMLPALGLGSGLGTWAPG